MTEVTRFEVPVHGTVELHGEGPWKVAEVGRGTFEIHDKNGRSARPTMYNKVGVTTFKSNQNVIFAHKSTPNAIVGFCNREFAKNNVV